MRRKDRKRSQNCQEGLKNRIQALFNEFRGNCPWADRNLSAYFFKIVNLQFQIANLRAYIAFIFKAN